jgi:hypothetical protein
MMILDVVVAGIECRLQLLVCPSPRPFDRARGTRVIGVSGIAPPISVPAYYSTGVRVHQLPVAH